jgi:hypothetical protein
MMEGGFEDGWEEGGKEESDIKWEIVKVFK